MKGDFTRFTFDPSKQYSGVRKQQGRVDLDADWNEAADIQAYLDAIQSTDVIGKCGVPKQASGFKVTIKPDGSDLELSSGRLYVKGNLCTVDTASYKDQPYLPEPPDLDPEDGRTDLVYLEVWQRHITAAEDPDLLEPALGGADTTTRLQTIWQVKVRQGVSASDCQGDVGTWPPVPPLDQRGKLTTKVTAGSPTTNPCLTAPGGGYQGLENRLYRVEIHDAGQPYGWPRPSGAVSTAVTSISNSYKAVLTDLSASGTDLEVGQIVEVYSQQTDAGGQAGTLARITSINQSTKTITLDKDISSLSGHTQIKLRRVATYKWSRDNGSIVFPIQEFVSGEAKKVQVSRLGRDQVLTLHPADWVEVLGDMSELWGIPGTLTSIKPDGIDEAEMKLTLAAEVAGHSGEKHPKVRRWDQKSAALAVTTQEVELEGGVKIQFGGSNMQSGDYWCFEARTATGEIDVLNDASPMGIERSFCKLAIVKWTKNSSSSTPWSGSTVVLCPPTFPPLTDIWAEDVFYDDSHCSSIQAETVQEAIDQLCAQRHLPYHNKHLHGWGIVCGLKVVCGPEDFDEPGDQVSVVVEPGYALDCEGNDIVLEEELQVAIFDMVKKWQKAHKDAKPLLTEKNGILSGEVSLIIERDDYGLPRVDLRPYDPSADNLKTLLQGTLLMDFIRECITEPLEDIQKFLEKPTGDFDKGSIVEPKQQQLIAIVNLIWQLFKAQYGSHVFFSLKEHTILENLYDELVGILISKTFCGMYHETPFPEYAFATGKNHPVATHDITTLFGRDAYQRIRIHPKGELGYAVGTQGRIGVFDLNKDVLIQELTFEASNAVVQDVAFSMNGKKIYVVALSSGGDSLLAAATVKGKDHKWEWVKPICGHSFLTLQNTKEALYGIARDEGLYSMDPEESQISLDQIASFNATGHLVLDQSGAWAFASAASNSSTASGYYDSVVKIDLVKKVIDSSFLLGEGRVGKDDIALSGDDMYLFAVVDSKTGDSTNNKKLLIFHSNSNTNPTTVDLEANTVIRLLSIPKRDYLAISYEDCYWLRLLVLENDRFVLNSAFKFPVQISPMGMAYGPAPKGSSTAAGLRVYILNGISTTLTSFPETYLTVKPPSTPSPAPGSAEFIAKLKEYRLKVLIAFLGLVGGFWQSLKDCLCERFLVDCPTCSSEDEVYLAKITIKDNEVYQVCNFSKRKYVKSFPTLEYWLSIVPVMPLIDKAVEMICCAILPNWFQGLANKPADVQFVRGEQIRQGYTFTREGKLKTASQSAVLKSKAVGMIAYDAMGAKLAQAVRPPTPHVPQDQVVGKDAVAARNNLAAGGIEVLVEQAYNPDRGFQNLQAATAPTDLPPGTKVNLYTENGVVRYYTVAEESNTRIKALEDELTLQKNTIETLRQQAPAEAGAAAPTTPSAGFLQLQAELATFKQQAASKDQELSDLRTKLATLETSQTAALASMREQINRLERKNP